MMRARFTLPLILGFALCACCAVPRVASGAQADRSDSLKGRSNSFVALPFVYYTPETKFVFGAGGIYSFRPAGSSPSDRPSSVGIAANYTQRKQIILAFMPEICFSRERYILSGYCGYYRYPDKFWGIGSDTPDEAEEDFESNDLRSNVSFMRRILPGLYTGIRYEYQYLGAMQTEPGGALGAGVIPGSLGGPASGLGLAVTHDTRDHIYRPTAGFYNQCYAVFFGSSIGSEYNFNALTVDLRMYRAVFGTHVLALQTYDFFISGGAPFQMLGLLGGSYSMRGYYLGRFRDRDMITAQVEYRVPVWWRFGAVAFAGVGNVGGGVRDLRIDRLKGSGGFGVRFMFNEREGINARLDVGFGSGDDIGIYARVLEAF